jgi:hypothetical protein
MVPKWPLLPIPLMPKTHRFPIQKQSHHAIPQPFQPKPHRPTFDCHVFCAGDQAERSNSTAWLQNEGNPTTLHPNKNHQFSIFKTNPLLGPLADSTQTQPS